MMITGRSDYYDKINENPSVPFLKDLANDLSKINKSYDKKQALKIKAEMIQLISKNL